MNVQLSQYLPTLGGSGLLLAVIGWLWRLLTQAERRHTSELHRVNSSHDAELNELRADIAELRREVHALRKELDEERRKRWHAEDAAAKARRGDPV